MYEHYKLFLDKMALPAEALEALTAAGSTLYTEHRQYLEHMVQKFYRVRFHLSLLEEDRNALEEKSGLNPHTLIFVFLCMASKYMRDDYRTAGLSDELFWDTIMDLKYKLMECKAVKGVWGTFVEHWYPIFFSLNIFKLGRLEFERVQFTRDSYTFGDITVNKGDTVYSVHIPSCGSLSKELRMDSYRRAFAHFREERGEKPLICICHSWLLYPQNREIFPATTNLVDFMGDWDIIDSEVDESFGDCWRVFSRDYDGNPDALPQNTTQQKALVNWLKTGKKTGDGFAVLLFDGEKIINR